MNSLGAVAMALAAATANTLLKSVVFQLGSALFVNVSFGLYILKWDFSSVISVSSYFFNKTLWACEMVRLFMVFGKEKSTVCKVM